MASFIGRSGYHALFADDNRGVIVDTRSSSVVAAGMADLLESHREWSGGEFSELDEAAAVEALASLDRPVEEPTGRLYTVPRGVQMEALKGRAYSEDYFTNKVTPGTELVADILAEGGQIDFDLLSNLAHYLERNKDHDRTAHEDGSPNGSTIAWKMHGGDVAHKWASAIVFRDGVTASVTPSFDDLETVLADNPEASPEFVARLHLDGSGIDRLYKVDLDGRSYTWDGDGWDTFGMGERGDIWVYDRALDKGEKPDVTHIMIDPESAIKVASLLQDRPNERVFIEDLDSVEYALAYNAIPELDWELLDSTLTAAGGTPGDGIYTPDERSQNASSQVRDSNGRFAKVGNRVMVGGNPATTGKISRINPNNGTVNVTLDNGQTVQVPGKSVEGIGEYTTTIPGQPVEVPRVDFSGILAEPRTPINRKLGQIPGTLPAMTGDDLHKMIYDFPAWVTEQRNGFKDGVKSPNKVGVQAKNSLDKGREGRAFEKEVGKKLTTDAYSNPLLNRWLNKQNRRHQYSNRLWYKPITAAAETQPGGSDVPPVYMAIVSPEDPRAVFKLIALVPAGPDSAVPMVYSREDGEWTADQKTLDDLNSATPPPVVPLTDEALNDCLLQVDDSQEQNKKKAEHEAEKEKQANEIQPEPNPAAAPPVVQPTPGTTAPAPVQASLSPDFDLTVLWGPRQDIIDAALVAAGGADRNRGQAEQLRRYWTFGPGGAKILWGTAGDWTRCVHHLTKYLGPRAKGYCALRHKEMTGLWTGDRAHRQTFSVNKGGKVLSTAMISSTDRVTQAAAMRARAAELRAKMGGITASADAVGAAFHIPLALPEGIESGDGRTIEPGAAEIRDLPISLLWQIKTDDGHKGSVVVGRIEELSRVENGIGMGFGHFDTGPYGREAERMVRAGFLRFVSADMDKFEAQEVAREETEAAEGAEPEKKVGRDRLVISKARVMAVTIVAKPAFQECRIELLEDYPQEEEMFIPADGLYLDDEADPIQAAALVAATYISSAIPLTPPAAWFENPQLDAPTPLTVTDDGRVFGHIAAWDQPHMSPNLSNVRPPRSRSGYAYFHNGVIRTEEHTDIPVGQLTLVGGHAGLNASAREAIKHYDDTASAFADVHAGEDEHGIWVSGALRPGTTPDQIRAIRASSPSGDWRPVKGHLELIAVCQVNVPGFPIARAMVASGHMTALVAAGAAELSRLKTDPVAEMASRLERLEQFTNRELAARAATAREAFRDDFAVRDAELAARSEAVLSRMEEFGYVSAKAREEAAGKGQALPDGSFPIRNDKDLKNAIHAYGRAKDEDKAKVRNHIMKRARALGHSDWIPEAWTTAASAALTASIADMREQIAARRAEFTTSVEEKKIRELLKEKGEVVPEGDADPKAPTVEETRPKYKPGHQPRDYNGQFRDILARLKENLGVSGNQAVIDKLKATDAKTQTGDYATAVKAGLDLKGDLDRLDEGSLNKEAIGSVRETARDLGKVIANLPLPFDNQAAKVRFSDIPPTLRDLMQNFIDRVEDKIGKDDAAKATAPLKAFMSGSDLFSQGEISKEMSKLLRLLT